MRTIRMGFVAVLGVVTVAPTLAMAQPGPDDAQGPPGSYAPAVPSSPPAAPRVGRKDPATAGWTSGLVTAAGLGLMIGAAGSNNGEGNGALAAVGAIAFVVGPTTGHVYAGHTWNAGLGIRLASVAAVVLGAASCNQGCDASDRDSGFAAAMIIGGIIGFGVGTVYEIGTAPGAARAYNHEHGLDVQLSVLPVRDARNALAPTVGLTARF